MGIEDDKLWPYLLCITKTQETSIKQYFRRKKWKTDSFICIPEMHRDVVLDILEEFKLSSCQKDLVAGYKTSPVGKPKSHGAGDRKQLVIDDIVYKHVGMFDEVLKLAETAHDVDDEHTGPGAMLDMANDCDRPVEIGQECELDRGNQIRMSGSSCVRIEHSEQDDDSDQDCDVGSMSESLVSPAADIGKDSSECSELVDGTKYSKTSKKGVETINEVKPTTKTNKKNYKDRKFLKTQNKTKGQTKLKCLEERRKKLRCSICGQAMASEQFYNRHMRLKHSQQATEKRAALQRRKTEYKLTQACQICHKQFSDKYTLQTHMTNIHSDSKVTYQCDLCGAVMKFKGSLVSHMKSVHTDKRPHCCEICGKQFKIRQQLKNHKRRHDPNNIETCTICGKTVKKGQLSGHLKRHTDNKPFQCSSCDKKFFEKQDLERHLRIHSGEKPFKCQHCSYASAIRGNLTKHLKHVKHKLTTETYQTTDAGLSYISIHRENMRKLQETVPEDPSVYTVHKHIGQRFETSPTSSNLEKQQNDIPAEIVSSSAQYTIPEEKIDKASSNIVSESGSREHINGVEMYAYQVSGKLILSDSAHVPVSHVELAKSTVSTHSAVEATEGLTSGYGEETALYTMKPVAELSYIEDQRQYPEGQAETKEAIPQFRDNYLQYMMPHVTDVRYPYTSQY